MLWHNLIQGDKDVIFLLLRDRVLTDNSRSFSICYYDCPYLGFYAFLRTPVIKILMVRGF